jgi:hypothetical protein
MRLHFLCCLVGIVPLTACGTWEPSRQARSPDGAAVARVEVKLRGTSGSNLTKIHLDNGRDGSLISPGEVVSADGAIVGATRISWSDPNELRVILCEARAYQVRARVQRDPVTRNDGSENAISINVENWRFSERRKECVAD